MIKFFRKLRYNLMEQNKTGKYLKYAIGEIILVVIGILIALQINNWNEKRLKQEQLISVYERTLTDIENDIQELTTNLEYYNGIEYIFKKVINDSITPDLFDVGLSRMLTTFGVATSLNMTGVNQLKTLNVKDSLSLEIIDVYANMEILLINGFEKRINQESEDLIYKFRDNYSWYPEYMGKTIMQDNSSKELQDYFLYNSEYRHRVISSYQLIYNNYVRMLNGMIPALKEITEELKIKLEKA
ncbi:DUF6090 family protein [Bizionia arctica]|uniref:Uncharacterized protein n=1 Tax=Bizionia arctica TaxID=1495645 RepID=A0A917GSX1_9FLAO|nr:DUF6090 family protein [Bizionia arctica]GGG55882.1 hypothetical protein GCM10010976_28410 [Bizionia arctica]